MTNSTPSISIVTPVFNEEGSILNFAETLRKVLDGIGESYEVIFVDDGSSDKSSELIKSFTWQESKLLTFVSNSGHMAALDAGIRAAQGNFVITLDSDLQHPPELIPTLLNVAREDDVDVVYANREKRTNDGFFKKASAKAFYKLIRGISGIEIIDSAADFRLISKRVVDVIRTLPEGRQVFRLLIPSLGFSSSNVPYEVQPRFAGESKYSFRKMLGLSVNSIIGYSTKPLTISITVGILFSIAALVGFGYVVVAYFSGNTEAGWPSLLSTILLSFGILFMIIGVMGLYIADIADIVRRRPVYIIKNELSDPALKETRS